MSQSHPREVRALVHLFKFRASWFFAAVWVLLAFCFTPTLVAQAVVLDFEDLQPVTVLNQYANRGVRLAT